MIVDIGREYFQSIDRFVNSQQYNVNISSVYEGGYISEPLEDGTPDYILSRLQENGCCVVDSSLLCNGSGVLSLNSLVERLSDFLGPLMDDGGGFTTIEAVQKPTHYFNSSFSQPLHTDEGHAVVYPRYVLLHCIKQAETGGDNIVVQLMPLYSQLVGRFGHNVDLLFDSKALKIHAKSGIIEKPILLNLGTRGVGVTFSPNLHTMTCSREVFQMYDFIARYVHSRKNQIRFKLKRNQFLILDNTAVFHGRTAFPRMSERILHRYWFGERKV